MCARTREVLCRLNARDHRAVRAGAARLHGSRATTGWASHWPQPPEDRKPGASTLAWGKQSTEARDEQKNQGLSPAPDTSRPLAWCTSVRVGGSHRNLAEEPRRPPFGGGPPGSALPFPLRADPGDPSSTTSRDPNRAASTASTHVGQSTPRPSTRVQASGVVYEPQRAHNRPRIARRHGIEHARRDGGLPAARAGPLRDDRPEREHQDRAVTGAGANA
jgi:hypothetical protein